ncbi:hypothetical protein BDW71DRAFT_175974 [Aspergillus fruticulosus]
MIRARSSFLSLPFTLPFIFCLPPSILDIRLRHFDPTSRVSVVGPRPLCHCSSNDSLQLSILLVA